MSIVAATTNPFGPATVDIQIEQGATFRAGLILSQDGQPFSLVGAQVAGRFSFTTKGKTVPVPLTVQVVDAAAGKVVVLFPAASTLDLQVPFNPSIDPLRVPIGKWTLTVTPSGNEPFRVMEGTVYLDRDPCLTSPSN